MKNLNFKYYPPKILLPLTCFIIAFYILIKHFFMYLFSNIEFINISIFKIIIDILLLSGTLALIFILINKYGMNSYFLKLLEITDLRGNYEGELESSFHYDDNEKLPHIKKFVKVKIEQNINGFIVFSDFYDFKDSSDKSSSSESISHDIKKISEHKFKVTYFYRNEANKFHYQDKTYGLNNHNGFAILYYDVY